ncbi:MAG: molybdopterin cofactor-binding domain-containing protein [Pseudomonadota bacterium]
MSIGKIARRTFLVGSAAIAGGVAFGAWAVRRDLGNPLQAGLADGETTLNPYVLIDGDGVTLITPRADVGQGATSIQTYLLAEELDVDPMTVRTSPGPASGVYFNSVVAAEGMPLAAWDEGRVARTGRGAAGALGKLVGLHLTGGSTTVPDMYDRLRAAGASARETLKAAAAARLSVDVADLRTGNRAVIAPDGTALRYEDLAVAAAALEPVTEVPLRDPAAWRWLGRDMRRTDIVAKSTGTYRYGTDVTVPDMVRATTLTRHGGLADYDASAAEDMRGIEAVIPITGGLAILADNDWRAMKAAREIKATWAAPDHPADSAAMWATHATALDGDRDSRFTDEGDVEAATGTPFEAEYRVPFLHHAPLEPANATVLYTPEATEVWTATQGPTFLARTVAGITGQDTEQVTIHALSAGGSFGHRLEDLWVRQAAEIAMQVPGRPVRLTFSREQDMANGYLRPMALARGRGTHKDGQVQSLDLAIAAHSVSESQLTRVGFPPIGPDVAIVAAAWDAPYTIPDRRVTGHRVPAGVGVSSWRSVGASHNGFFYESLLDELIHAAGADPVAERLRLLHHAPSRNVLETVAEMANWSGPKPSESVGRGVAFSFSFGVPVAEIVEVRDTENGLVLENLWIAAELGRVLDPINAEAQLSGGALFGIGHAIHSEITFADHQPEQSNFHDFESLRLWQTPNVTVRALGTTGEIRGAGEPGLPPAAPALGNAIFAATGKRLREMPFAKAIRFA